MQDESSGLIKALDWMKGYWEILTATAFGAYWMARQVKFHFFDRVSALERLTQNMATKDELESCRKDMINCIETKVEAIGDRIIDRMDAGLSKVHERIDNHLDRRSRTEPYHGEDRRGR